MKLFSFGTDPSEVAYARGGELLPLPPKSFTNGGGKNAKVGGSLTYGIGQGIGFGVGLVALGAAYAFVKQRAR